VNRDRTVNNFLLSLLLLSIFLIGNPWPLWGQVTRSENMAGVQRESGEIALIFQAGKHEIKNHQYEFKGIFQKGQQIRMEGFGSTGSPGDPLLPLRVYDVALPPDVDWKTVKLDLEEVDPVILPGDYRILPRPPRIIPVPNGEIVDWGEGKKIVDGRNSKVYESDQFHPSDSVTLLSHSQMRKWKFIRVGFTPIQYNPVLEILRLIPAVRVRITYERIGMETFRADPLLTDTVMDSEAQERFVNFEEAIGWYRYTPPSQKNESSSSPIQVQAPPPSANHYVIITTNAIKNGSTKLNDFLVHKGNLGYTVQVVTEDDYGPLTGQPPNGTSEKIRQWLINNYVSLGIKYVLLIGNPHPLLGDVPMKICQKSHSSLIDTFGNYSTPTDYFYADLTGNWDLDGDGIFCEVSPQNLTPAPTIDPGTYSIRWTGKIQVNNPGTNYIRLDTQGGVRLKIDNVTIIENWTNHSITGDEASVDLSAGFHDIQLDFYSVSGDAVMQMRWTTSTTTGGGLRYYHLEGAGYVPDGLNVEYFNNIDFTDLSFTGIDYSMYHFWGTGDSGPGGIDFTPEVYVGRIPVYNADYATLDHILQKFIDYEKVSVLPSWRKRVLLPMKPLQAEHPSYDIGEYIKNDCAVPAGFGYFRIYDENYGLNPPPEATPCTEANVLAEWPKGYGLVAWQTHGNVYEAASVFHKDSCPALDDTKPSFTFQPSCLNGKPEEEDNLGYSLLKHGAVVTISASRMTGYSPELFHPDPLNGSGDHLCYYYSCRLLQNDSAGKAYFTITATAGQSDVAFNLYGDPSLSLQSAYSGPPNAPGAAPFLYSSFTCIRANWKMNGNPSWTEYYVENTTAGTNSGWITATSWDSCGLGCDTSYSFRVKARNDSGVTSNWTSLGTQTTDCTPPSPNPMTWAMAPYATGTTSISMVATTASDPSLPISYYFDFVDSPTGGTGGVDSGWQSGTSYTNSGLQVNHQYGYQVKARDGANSETTFSSPTRYVYTAIGIPSPLSVFAGGPSIIYVRPLYNIQGLTLGSSGLLIENMTNGTNSGWRQDNNWWEFSSLTANTSYSFRAKARNGDGIETDYTPVYSKYSLAKEPGFAVFSNVTQTCIRANWVANGNPAGTSYYCENITAGTNSGWITATSWDSCTLTPNTSYSFRVKAKNGDGVETNWASLDSKNTLSDDTTPPTPNPMTWAMAPYATGTTSISMVPTAASDPSPPVNYYFDFVDSPTGGTGGADSGWQAGTSYTNSGLQVNHQYGYRVKARDGVPNETGLSAPTSYTYTAIETPSAIAFGTITSTSIQAQSTNTLSGLTRGGSGLMIENTTNATNSGWKQDNTFWTSGSLSPNTSYSFRAMAKNGDGVATAYSSSASKCTQANAPSAGSFINVTQTCIRANWTANGNPAGTQYYCENTTAGTNSGWITSTSWDSCSLTPNTSYTFRVKAKNADGVETSWTSLGNQSTLSDDTTPPTPNPMTWAMAPYATGTTSISMVATTASDPSLPINYYFDFVDSPTGGTGGADSGWQVGTSYMNSGLQINHQYGYRVKARDGVPNETSFSAPTSYTYSAIETPSAIAFGTITSTSIQAQSTNTPSGLTRGGSGLMIENTTNATNSGWKQDNTFWTSGSLSPNTSYSFRAMAKNGDGVATAYSSSASKYTLANTPSVASFNNVTQTCIRANWTANGNPAGTQYYGENTTAGTNSGWITSTSWDSCNHSCGISYNFRVKARNTDGVETDWTSLGSQLTGSCDTTAPSPPQGLSPIPNVWTNINSFAVNWTNPSDPSGIVAVWYKIGSPPTSSSDGIKVQGNNIQSLSGLSLPSEGEHSLYVWLEDGGGNKDHNNRGQITLRYDGTAPVSGSISINGGNASVNSLIVTLNNLGASDLSGLSQMRFSNHSAGPWSSPEACASTRGSWNLSQYGGNTNLGQKTVYVQFMDAAGSWSDSFSAGVYYQPLQTFPFIDDFSTDKGWFGYESGGWERSPALSDGGENGYPDPGIDYSASADNYLLGFAIGADYPNDLAEKSIISPPIDCTGQDKVFLKFRRYLNVEGNDFAHARIYVSKNGMDWVQVWENPPIDLMDNEWVPAVFDISSVAANQATVYIKFTMGPTNSSRRFSGWNIDDFAVTSEAIFPSEGTMGTKLTIAGPNFGTKKGKVLIGTTALTIIDWGNELIHCQLTKPLAHGVYNVIIQPSGPKGTPSKIEKEAFVVKAPEIYSIEQGEGTANDQVTIKGKYFGTKKGTVYLEYGEGESSVKKSCKVSSWSMYDLETGDSKIVFVVPTMLPEVCNVVVDPPGMLPETEEKDGFEVKAPEIEKIEPSSGSTDDQITISGNYFGSKKGKVYLGYLSNGKPVKKSCSVVSGSDDEIIFTVPKLPVGTYDVIVTNSVSSGTLPGGFIIK